MFLTHKNKIVSRRSNLENQIMRDSLKEIDNKSLVDRVEKQLIDLFISKKVNMGDPIPKEVELAEILGVSRTVIREALLRLRMIGLIDSKKKRGAVLTNPDLMSLLKKGLYPTVLSDDTLKDMFEMRLVLEVGMADLLFKHITDDDIQKLEEIVANEPELPDRTIFSIEHEVAFHSTLYDISKNKTLKEFQQMLLPVFEYVQSSGLLESVTAGDKFTSHQDLVEILKTGDAEQFRNGMRSHLDSHYHRIGIPADAEKLST